MASPNNFNNFDIYNLTRKKEHPDKQYWKLGDSNVLYLFGCIHFKHLGMYNK